MLIVNCVTWQGMGFYHIAALGHSFVVSINNMASTWVELLKKSQKTCIIQDGRRKIHYTFANENELAEEYDIKTNELVGKFKRCFNN